MLIHGFTPEEWQQFSKAERRVLALVHDLHYERSQICQMLEIKDGTLRFHIASIRKKQSRFREERAKAGFAIEIERARAVSLPEQTIPAEERVMTYQGHDKKGNMTLVTRNANSNLTMKELLEPLDGPPISPTSIPPKPSGPFLTVPNPTVHAQVEN